MPPAPVYPEEYRRQAVDLIATENLSVAEAARRLVVGTKTLRRWVTKYRPTPTTTAPTPPVEQELRRLREENRQLKMERDILKKAAIYLVQPPT